MHKIACNGEALGVSSNENWVRDQVVAAHRQIERERLEAEQRIERNEERAAALAAAATGGSATGSL